MGYPIVNGYPRNGLNDPRGSPFRNHHHGHPDADISGVYRRNIPGRLHALENDPSKVLCF